MNNGEREEVSSTRSPNRLRAYAGLLQDVSTLIAELESNRAANQAEANFSFEIIGENEIMIPQAVRDALPDLDQITVTIGKAEEEHPSYLSVNFSSDDKNVIISRSGLEEPDSTSDVVIDMTLRRRVDYKPDGSAYSSVSAEHQIKNEGPDDFADRQTGLNKVSRAELNALIMSLVHPNPDRLYAPFDEVDFLNPGAYDSLRDSFELAALNNQHSFNYQFRTTDTTFNFIKREGQPISFDVSYLDKKSDRRIRAQSDLETDFKIEFSTPEAVEENPYYPGEKEFVRVPYYPTTEEVNYLLSILKTEIESINPITLEIADMDTIDNNSPESRLLEKGTAVFSREYVRDVLQQLGLDAPDSSTT